MSSEPRLNILVAYPYMTADVIALLKEHRNDVRLLLDSGAFTAWKAGKTIALDDYCTFLEELPIKPWRYFMLDVVGDPKATQANYAAMLKRGFKPVPIFTRGDDPKRLEDFYATSDVVGVGGLVRTKRNRGYVNGIMEKIGTRPVHWLGFSDALFLKHYKPYSCDASGWNQRPYGKARLYLGGGRSAYIEMRAMTGKPLAPDICARIKHYGYEPAALARKSGWAGAGARQLVANQLTYRSMVDFAADVERNLGTFYFLSCGYADLVLLVEAWERMNR